MKKTFRDFKSLLVQSQEFEQLNKKESVKEEERRRQEIRLLKKHGAELINELHNWKVK